MRRLRRRNAAAVLTAACSAVCTTGAWAAGNPLPSSLLPLTGTDVRVGDLSGQVASALGLAPPPEPGLRVTPSIGVREIFTDNVLQTSQGRRADLITEITPMIEIEGETRRLQVQLAYSPVVQLHAFTAHQNVIGHEANAHALLTIVPDELFLDLRGFATLQSTTGGYNPSGPVTLNRQNETQTASVSVSPYFQHRFGGWGTLQVGYVYTRTFQSNPLGSGATFQVTPSGAVLPSSLVRNDVTSHEEYASFTTGENLGRVNNQFWVAATQQDGAGLLANARRNVVIDQPAYAISRALTVYGQIGWEDLEYPNAVPPVRIRDAIWAVGARINPNPDTSITVQYGHRDGVNSPLVNVSYQLTQRTRLFLRYSEGLTTTADEIADAVSSSDVGPGGAAVDPYTGAPLLLANQLLGIEDNLYRARRFSFTAVTSLNRDTLSLTLLNEQRSTVAVSPGLAAFSSSQRASSASITWSRSVTPQLTTTALLQYGRTSGGTTALYFGSNRQDVVTADLSAAYTFSETLTGVAEYTLINRFANGPNTGMVQNVALVGLRKTF